MPGVEDDLIGDGRWALPPANLLLSSDGRTWSGVAAETRRHTAAEVPEMIADRTVVALALRGNPDAVIHRRGNGLRQVTPAATGTFWLCPQGIAEDSIRITGDIPEMLHIYLPHQPFRALSREDDYPDLDALTVVYAAGPYDVWIAEVGRTIAAELAFETASGRLLVETAALTLAASLAHRHVGGSLPVVTGGRRLHALDAVRLARVRDYIAANLDDDIGVGDLAAVACLSQFHFIRAFKAATGLPPHRYLGLQRLERAKVMLRLGRMPLADVALACRFSSQANFTRAFRRAVGVPPGAYRSRRQ
ncbi:helix-turn-helix domain-containing protein [Methylobacterium sp. WL64]|uniref:helix-turn-helix domain-containing protein n=1 Tax=Methylobacterium sp. WL64 TaxID=2603894 RepID=UPI00164EE432|nr:AraC family transcriptional regulator [Methylobacterium sp. WL64]